MKTRAQMKKINFNYSIALCRKCDRYSITACEKCGVATCKDCANIDSGGNFLCDYCHKEAKKFG